MSKRNIMISYERLPEIVRAELRKIYPDGFQNHIKSITDFKDKTIHVLRHETEDSIYLIKIENVKAAIIDYLSSENPETLD